MLFSTYVTLFARISVRKKFSQGEIAVILVLKAIAIGGDYLCKGTHEGGIYMRGRGSEKVIVNHDQFPSVPYIPPWLQACISFFSKK